MNRILVVDDAVTVRLYHRKMLEDAGWKVDEAANGMEALEKTLALDGDERYDLYLVDINMPRMDGYTFVRELRRQDVRGAAPVMMVSTEAQLNDARAAEDAGANTYLVKPAKPRELVLTAALLLGDRRAAEASATAIGEHKP